MTNTPQIDAFIKRMKTPLYAKTPIEFKYGRLMGRALRLERALNADLERWALWARAMHCADDAYGTGYYGQAEWIAAYKELRRMAGMGSEPNL